MENSATYKRTESINLSKDEFRKIGHQLVDQLADFLDSIADRPVTTFRSPSESQKILGGDELPEYGIPSDILMERTSQILFDHSLFNGHPKFSGYITSSPAPLGILGDLLASTINPNVGAQILSPMATEIEKQTIKWLCEFIGVDPESGGILVSGGNMANFTAFLAGRTAKAPEEIKKKGLGHEGISYRVYCSQTTHTWIDKAAILFGLGTDSIQWIETDDHHRMDNQKLEEAILKDKNAGHYPLMIIGTAGDVSTGVVDDLQGISKLCATYDLWFHVDGAYGAPAAVVPELNQLFAGIEAADSIALDPHKWLYSPLECGCTLVKNPQHLIDTFSSHPEYYNFSKEGEEPRQNYYEFGLQNSRGFRALKTWLVLQQVGRKDYEQLIREDIEMSEYLFRKAKEHPELEAISQSLSITTFRYLPKGENPENTEQLNKLNEALVDALQAGGKLFLSNAMVDGTYCMRSCIVNFRTTMQDIDEIVEVIVEAGRKLSVS